MQSPRDDSDTKSEGMESSVLSNALAVRGDLSKTWVKAPFDIATKVCNGHISSEGAVEVMHLSPWAEVTH